MPNTASGWPYPASTATPDGPRDIKALADALEDRAAPRIQAGRSVVSVSAAASGTAVNQVFPVPFAVIPRVVATVAIAGSAMWAVCTDVVTTSQMAIRVRHIDGTSSTASVTVDWIAMDPS
jgi:hypothetical protein